MRLIHLLLMLCGIAVMAHALFQQGRVTSVWSSFVYLESQIRSLEHGSDVLNGSAAKGANFPEFLERLSQLKNNAAEMWLGFAVFVLSFTALVLTTRKSNGPGSNPGAFIADDSDHKTSENV